MTSQGSAHGRFQRAIQRRNLFQAELAIRELGTLSLLDAGLPDPCSAAADSGFRVGQAGRNRQSNEDEHAEDERGTNDDVHR